MCLLCITKRLGQATAKRPKGPVLYRFFVRSDDHDVGQAKPTLPIRTNSMFDTCGMWGSYIGLYLILASLSLSLFVIHAYTGVHTKLFCEQVFIFYLCMTSALYEVSNSSLKTYLYDKIYQNVNYIDMIT